MYIIKKLYLQILHQNIDLLERKDNKPSLGGPGQGGSLILKCKDLRVVQLEISTTSELTKVSQTLEALCSLSDPRLLYPFFYKPMFTILEDGYKIFRYVLFYNLTCKVVKYIILYVYNKHAIS